MEPSGWCWACGRVCAGLFCDAKCQRRYERALAVIEKRIVRRGRRNGYGAAGSTH